MNIKTEVCKKSPSKKHVFKHKGCWGSWHHNDPGGPLYKHKSKKCIHCGFSVCYDWNRKKRIKGEGGWY